MKLKRYFMLMAVICFSNYLFSQNTFPSSGKVGIGTTTPNASSLLEVKSTTKGMLIPRMTEAQRNAIASPATSLIIYQTDNNPGFFYYTGTGWLGLASKISTWNVTGNSTIDSASNFIGTIGQVPFSIRTNDTERVHVSSNGNVGIGTTTPQAKLDVNGDAHINGLTIGKGGGNITTNSAVGYQALSANTTGSYNTATGNSALYDNTTGTQNIANGYQALYYNTTGIANTANGVNTLYSNTSGSGNTANGINALALNTTGYYNTAYGADALEENTTGSYNSALGFDAYPTNGTVSNYTGIGYDVGGNTSTSNEVELGNSSVSVIRGQVNFSTYSDKRIKNNIQQNVPGLAFITKLTPVTYRLDIHKENDMMYAGKTINGKSEKDVDFAGKYDLEKKQMTGFLAQDVEAAAEAVHYDFSGVVKPRNDHDLYSLRYSDFVVPLVKAVQELSKQNDSKDASIDTLKQMLATQQQEIDELKAMIVSSTTTNQSALISSASLQQNIPNPFSSSTTIGYNLPANYSSANIIVTDAKGVVLKQININSKGKGNIQLDASTLAAGAYRYVLYVDGKMIDSKQMISSK